MLETIKQEMTISTLRTRIRAQETINGLRDRKERRDIVKEQLRETREAHKLESAERRARKIRVLKEQLEKEEDED